MQEQAYVLGTHDEELNRLGLQAHLWRPQAHGLWQQAGFRRGHTLLDLGCGPGYATLDLARLAGAQGQVLAVDASARYVEYLQRQPQLNDSAPVKAWVQDAQELDLPEASIDGVWERWCMCFVPSPEKVLKAIVKTLKPGGRLAFHEYVNYECMRLAPRSRAFERVVEAAAQSFRALGGDPDVAARLPGMLASLGMRVTHLEPLVRKVYPDDELWQWPQSFFFSYVPTLVERGLLSPADQQAFEADWREWSNRTDTAFYSPMLVGLIAVKSGIPGTRNPEG